MGNQSIELKMGNQTTKVDLGRSPNEAMQSIELKVGQSSIMIDPDGRYHQGHDDQDSKAQIQVQVQGVDGAGERRTRC